MKRYSCFNPHIWIQHIKIHNSTFYLRSRWLLKIVDQCFIYIHFFNFHERQVISLKFIQIYFIYKYKNAIYFAAQSSISFPNFGCLSISWVFSPLHCLTDTLCLFQTRLKHLVWWCFTADTCSTRSVCHPQELWVYCNLYTLLLIKEVIFWCLHF